MRVQKEHGEESRRYDEETHDMRGDAKKTPSSTLPPLLSATRELQATLIRSCYDPLFSLKKMKSHSSGHHPNQSVSSKTRRRTKKRGEQKERNPLTVFLCFFLLFFPHPHFLSSCLSSFFLCQLIHWFTVFQDIKFHYEKRRIILSIWIRFFILFSRFCCSNMPLFFSPLLILWSLAKLTSSWVTRRNRNEERNTSQGKESFSSLFLHLDH